MTHGATRATQGSADPAIYPCVIRLLARRVPLFPRPVFKSQEGVQ